MPGRSVRDVSGEETKQRVMGAEDAELTRRAIDWYCEYFATHEDFARELHVAERVRALSQPQSLDQAEYDTLMNDVARCPEGSVIAALWRHLRRWGLAHGLSTPDADSFPWS